jgi:hypothetical protein
LRGTFEGGRFTQRIRGKAREKPEKIKNEQENRSYRRERQRRTKFERNRK